MTSSACRFARSPFHGARRVAETLRREIAERPVPWSGGGLTVTASFGLAQAMPGEVNVPAVIARADQALHRAKDAGRNCVRDRCRNRNARCG